MLQLVTDEVDMSVGADQGGSIRMPAAWCGIVGLKPTYGLVPYTGIMPIEYTLDHCGPMAKTVYNCALLLEVGQCYLFLNQLILCNISNNNMIFQK